MVMTILNRIVASLVSSHWIITSLRMYIICLCLCNHFLYHVLRCWLFYYLLNITWFLFNWNIYWNCYLILTLLDQIFLRLWIVTVISSHFHTHLKWFNIILQISYGHLQSPNYFTFFVYLRFCLFLNLKFLLHMLYLLLVHYDLSL